MRACRGVSGSVFGRGPGVSEWSSPILGPLGSDSVPGMKTGVGAVAQLVERIVRNDEVGSSTLLRST